MAEKRIIFPPQGIRSLHLPIAFVNTTRNHVRTRMRGTMSHVHRGIHEGHAVYLPTRSLPPVSHVCFTWLRARMYSQLWISLNDRTNLCIRPRLPGLHLTVPGLIKETVYPMRYVCSLSRMNKIENSIENRDENVEGDVACNTRFFNG